VFLVRPASYSSPGLCWGLCKTVYCLFSAPKAWLDKFCEVLQKYGFTSDLSDEAIFWLRDYSGNIVGILAVHVDDKVGGSLQIFYIIMAEVTNDLTVGSTERQFSLQTTSHHDRPKPKQCC
jgi:hypothetical protein